MSNTNRRAHQPPVTLVRRVSPYPHARAEPPTSEPTHLRQILPPNTPCVIHLYTGWGGCWPCASQMDEWQRRYQGRCSFVCICCDGPDLAEAFAKRLRLTSCYNAVAAENPAWGQLGCSGFIVLDAAGNVTCKSTSAFLDVREQAFEHVETLVDAMLGGAVGAGAGGDDDAIAIGATVELRGLKARPELNGVRAVCVDVATAASGGRCTVEIGVGQATAVKPANLKLVVEKSCAKCGGRGDGCCPEVDALASVCATKCEIGGGGWQPVPRGAQKRERGACDVAPPARKLASPASPSDDSGVPSPSVAPLHPTASVHVAELDAEHERCAAALSALAERRDAPSLRGVIDEYTAHFAHEEALLDEHLYGGEEAPTAAAAGGFSIGASMRRSHWSDHKKMLDELSALDSALRERRALLGGGALLSHEEVDGALRRFEKHADLYDGSYAVPLSQKMGVATSA